jgi:hypothetical protein
MEQNTFEDLIKIIRNFRFFDENDKKIKEEYPEYEFADSFEDIFEYEIKKESYKEFLSKFLNWSSELIRELKQMNSEDGNLSFDYSCIYYSLINYFGKNTEEYLVSQAGYLTLNSVSDNIDPGYCNQISEEIAGRGRLDVLHIYAEDFLIEMAGTDYEYIYFLIQEHKANVDPAFPDRLEIILKSDYYDPEFICDDSPAFEDDEELFY